MTDETVDCFNCGRANPEWAQVCRSCGVVLRHGEARIAPAGRFPTDRDSLVSMAAVVGTIVVAVLLGLFISNLNPTEPTVGEQPSPTATPSPDPEPEPPPASGPVASTDAPAASPSATPALPASIVFGTELNADNQVVEPVETFTPGMTFAHSITSTEPFGADVIGEEVVRVLDDGTTEVVVSHTGENPNVLNVNPEATSVGFVGPDASVFIRSWGPGLYQMRVYIGETVIARKAFRLAEG